MSAEDGTDLVVGQIVDECPVEEQTGLEHASADLSKVPSALSKDSSCKETDIEENLMGQSPLDEDPELPLRFMGSSPGAPILDVLR